MKPTLSIIAAAAVLCTLLPASLPGQALPNLTSLRLGYTVRKRTVNPEGELKAKIDAVDRELAEATRLGKAADVRRLLAKGQSLLAGQDWTETADFAASLVVRSDRVFVDTLKPYAVRLEQLYSPAIELPGPLTARVSLRKPPEPRPGRGGVGAAPPGAEVVKELGTFDELSRDLRESPHRMELDLANVPDGNYHIRVEVFHETRSLGEASLRIVAQGGMDAALARLEAEASGVPETLRAELLYPLDFVRNVNRGQMDRGAFDLAKELISAGQVLSAARAGQDPFAGRTGDFKRHYLLTAAKEIMPYRLYVPTNHSPARAFPLVVALHGLGGTEDSMFGPNYGITAQAEQRGYIVVAPLGYRVDGGYGSVSGAINRRGELSEQDVLEALKRVRQDYKIDEDRIYLMGHSMGGIGTWRLGAKHPTLWAGLAPIAGWGLPASVERMRHIAQIVVHGDADNVVPVDGSRAMVAEMKRLGGDVKYIEVPGGDHVNIAGPNVPAIFDFFDAHRRTAAAK